MHDPKINNFRTYVTHSQSLEKNVLFSFHNIFSNVYYVRSSSTKNFVMWSSLLKKISKMKVFSYILSGFQ